MDWIGKHDRTHAVAAAVASELNDELTIILTGLSDAVESLDFDDPLVPVLLEAQAASQRCAWRAAALLDFSSRKGMLPGPVSVDHLLDY